MKLTRQRVATTLFPLLLLACGGEGEGGEGGGDGGGDNEGAAVTSNGCTAIFKVPVTLNDATNDNDTEEQIGTYTKTKCAGEDGLETEGECLATLCGPCKRVDAMGKDVLDEAGNPVGDPALCTCTAQEYDSTAMSNGDCQALPDDLRYGAKWEPPQYQVTRFRLRVKDSVLEVASFTQQAIAGPLGIAPLSDKIDAGIRDCSLVGTDESRDCSPLVVTAPPDLAEAFSLASSPRDIVLSNKADYQFNQFAATSGSRWIADKTGVVLLSDGKRSNFETGGGVVELISPSDTKAAVLTNTQVGWLEKTKDESGKDKLVQTLVGVDGGTLQDLAVHDENLYVLVSGAEGYSVQRVAPGASKPETVLQGAIANAQGLAVATDGGGNVKILVVGPKGAAERSKALGPDEPGFAAGAPDSCRDVDYRRVVAGAGAFFAVGTNGTEIRVAELLLENTDLKCVPSADGLNPVHGEPYEVYFEGNPGTLTVLSTAN